MRKIYTRQSLKSIFLNSVKSITVEKNYLRYNVMVSEKVEKKSNQFAFNKDYLKISI
jgi:hypothetical protein